MAAGSPPASDASVCALPGCDVAVVQPPRGGRRRLYCSNAHRAEARRRRLGDTAEPEPADRLRPVLDRLAGALEDLRSYEAAQGSIDPGRQAAELARVRAEATAEVLAAQQAAAAATEDAARLADRLDQQRAAWDQDAAALRAELDELREELAKARDRAASVQDALDATRDAHRRELEHRDAQAAKVAAAHGQELARLSAQLEAARTEAAAAEARADSADRRAAEAEQARREHAERADELEATNHDLQVQVATAQAEANSAQARADAAEQLTSDIRGELEAERARHDANLTQLNDRVAELLSRTSARRRPTTASKTGTKRPARSA